MIVKSEMSLADCFTFWAGAVSTVKLMTSDQISEVESVLDELYPDGMGEFEINDTFWFELDFLANCNGFEKWDDMMEFNNDEN